MYPIYFVMDEFPSNIPSSFAGSSGLELVAVCKSMWHSLSGTFAERNMVLGIIISGVVTCGEVFQ